jgi:hypothetical protein
VCTGSERHSPRPDHGAGHGADRSRSSLTTVTRAVSSRSMTPGWARTLTPTSRRRIGAGMGADEEGVFGSAEPAQRTGSVPRGYSWPRSGLPQRAP